jgi:hypothetical protein
VVTAGGGGPPLSVAGAGVAGAGLVSAGAALGGAGGGLGAAAVKGSTPGAAEAVVGELTTGSAGADTGTGGLDLCAVVEQAAPQIAMAARQAGRQAPRRCVGCIYTPTNT